MNTRLLIIGASGFLGGHVLREAAARGHDVVTAGRSARPGSAPPGSAAHHRLDLSADSPSRVAEVIGSIAPGAVINCAGATAGAPDLLAAANITAVHALVTAMIAARLPARLVQIGSAAEYGHAIQGAPVTESAVPRPVGAYGVTKLAGTRLVELARTAGLDAVVLRVFNAVGAGAPPDGLPGHAALLLRQAVACNTELRLGPLDGVRDYVDVRDVADAVLAAARVPALPHSIINIGSGRGVASRALIRELLAISGHDGALHEDAAGSARSADVPWVQADITRARQDLRWQPSRDLKASVSDLWEGSRDAVAT